MKSRSAVSARLPDFVEPMKAKLVDSIRPGDWIYEILRVSALSGRVSADDESCRPVPNRKQETGKNRGLDWIASASGPKVGCQLDSVWGEQVDQDQLRRPLSPRFFPVSISTAFVESAINQVVSKRMVKKQQMRWTDRGAHLLLQVRTRVLNEEWRSTLSHW